MKKIYLLIILVLFVSCTDTRLVNELERYKERNNWLTETYTDLEKENKELINQINEQNRKITLLERDLAEGNDILIGSWSTNWPANSGTSTNIYFYEDNTFIYQNELWYINDNTNLSFPQSTFYGLYGSWKLDNNKILVSFKNRIYQEFNEVERFISDYWPKDPTFQVIKIDKVEWFVIGDLRTYRNRWVLSEDNYPGGSSIYPEDEPDIATINILNINEEGIQNGIVSYISYGKNDEFINIKEFYSEIIGQ